MKLIFQKSKLIEAVTPLMGAVSSKNTIAALGGILFESNSDKCILYAYDLEKGMRNIVPCEVVEEGSYVLDAQKLFSSLRTMPQSEIIITVNPKNNRTVIESGNAAFELTALNGEDFPDLPAFEGENGYLVPQSRLSDMLKKTMFASAIDDSRACLNGAFFRIENGSIKVVCCDGNRLAYCENQCEMTNTVEGGAEKVEFIVPVKTLGEILRQMDESDEPVELLLTHKHIILKKGDFVLFSRLIDQQYVEYTRFIPKTNKIFVNLDTDWLVSSVERTLLVTEEHQKGQVKAPVRFRFVDQTLTVGSASVTSSTSDSTEVEKEGEDIEIGFNCRLLYDALKVCDFPRLRLSLSSPFMSMLIEPEEQESGKKLLLLVLPVRLKNVNDL